MSIVKEFKEFAVKGNVIDLAIGIIIGAAFGKIVTSLVNDLIMPVIGLLLGNVEFTDLIYPLRYAADGTVAVAIRYGIFISTILDFLIIALSIFFVIKGINRMKRKQEVKEKVAEKKEEKEVVSNQEKLLREIRDLLKNNKQ